MLVLNPEKKKSFLRTVNLQAVEGKPPNKDIGREGAVGHIHLICTVSRVVGFY